MRANSVSMSETQGKSRRLTAARGLIAAPQTPLGSSGKVNDTMTSTMPNVSTDDVDAFCNFCVSLRSIYRHYQILFEEGADLRRELLQSIAPTFLTT